MYKNWMNDVQDGSESCTSLEEYKKIAIFESGHRYFFIYRGRNLNSVPKQLSLYYG